MDSRGQFHIVDEVVGRLVTGLVLRPVFAAEHHAATRPACYREAFRVYWELQKQPKPLAEFADDLYADRIDRGLFDFAGRQYWDEIRRLSGIPPEEAPLFHCCRCGKVFAPGIDWKQVYRPMLLRFILKTGAP